MRLLLVCLLFVNLVQAQHKDTIQLKELVSVAYRPISQSIGKITDSLDSAQMYQGRNKTLADLLQQNTPYSFKIYGVNGSVGAAIRGGGSDHTAVVWNGISLQSPTHGQFDFSTFPAFFIQRASVQAGPSSSAYGSGAVSAVIQLESFNHYQSQNFLQPQVLVSLGSWGHKTFGLGLESKRGKWQNSVKLYRQQVLNKFEVDQFLIASQNAYYKLKSPYRTQNGRFDQEAAMLISEYRASESNQFSFAILPMQSYRELLNSSDANQKDKAFRSALNHRFSNQKFQIQQTLGFNLESLVFNQNSTQTHSSSQTQSITFNTGGSYWLRSNLELFLYPQWQFIRAKVDGYGTLRPNQNRSALWSGLRYRISPLRISLETNVRFQYTDHYGRQILPGLGFSYQILRSLKLNVSSAVVYHAPDFNDLYWAIGGNPNLKAENGWSHEASLEWKKNSLHLTALGFLNELKNPIVWLPGSSYWSPRNLFRSQSSGIESKIKYPITIGLVPLSLSAAYAYTLAEAEYYPGELKRQMLYIPRHKVLANASAAYKLWTLSIQSQFYSKRYTSYYEEQWLPPYYLIQLRLERRLSLLKGINFFAEVQNLSNQFYMVQPGYPMPRRSFYFGITLN